MYETIAAMGLLGLVMSFMMAGVAWYVLTLVARWKVFDKAGIEGWKSLIPFYSDFCTYRIAWNTTYYWILMAATVISGFVSSRMSGYTENGEAVPAILSVLSTVLGLALMVINLLMNIKLSEKFGHGILFGLGLTFLTPVFTMILGFGSSDYLGNPEEGLPSRVRVYM